MARGLNLAFPGANKSPIGTASTAAGLKLTLGSPKKVEMRRWVLRAQPNSAHQPSAAHANGAPSYARQRRVSYQPRPQAWEPPLGEPTEAPKARLFLWNPAFTQPVAETA